MKNIFIGCLLTLVFLDAQAQSASPRTIAETFLTTIAQGKTAVAYGKLFEGSNISKDRGAGVAIKKQTDAALPPLGKVMGYELVREEPFGASLVRLVYLLKSERHPTSWEFLFYKPKNTWFVAEINFTDKFYLLDAKQ